MLLLRYFVVVGGALLALLWIVGGAPTPSAIGTVAASDDQPSIRIHSDRKLPERVVLDTTQPTIKPPPAMTAEAAPVLPPAPAQTSAKARVRDTFAQFVPPEAKAGAKKAESRPQAPKRKVARAHPPGPRMMLVAQQPRYGFFNFMW